MILVGIAVFWTGLVGLAHFFPTAPFLSTVWRGERSFADVTRREGRKTMTHSDFAFLGIDQASLSLKPEEEDWSNNRALQLMTEHAYPWSRELWGLLLDRLFQAGARLVMFDIVFDKPKEGDDIFRAALDRYRDKVVIGANFDLSQVRQLGGMIVNVPPAESLIPPPQMQDDRVGCVIIFPDPLDNRIRSVCYRFTDQQLLGNDPLPSEVPYEALSTRALRKLGNAGDRFSFVRAGRGNGSRISTGHSNSHRFHFGFDRRRDGLDARRFLTETVSDFCHIAYHRCRLSRFRKNSLRPRRSLAHGRAADERVSHQRALRSRI